MKLSKRISTVGIAAGLAVASAVTLGATLSSANAVTLGMATVTPGDHLKSGDAVTVSVSGFPSGAVAGVQCDARIITTSDDGWCDTVHATIFVAGADGKGTASATVYSGAEFVSANGKGVCDAQHDCVFAFQDYPAGTTAAIASVYFGTDSKVDATPAAVKTTPSKAVKIAVAVSSTDGPLTGTVKVKDGKKSAGELTLAEDGTATFSKKLGVGTHKLVFSYAGDANYLASSDKVTVTVAKKKKH